MIKSLLKTIRVIFTQNPLTTLQNLVRLKPKLSILLSLGFLILNFAGIPGLNIISAAFAVGLVYEFKRLLPFNIFNNQSLLKKSSLKYYDEFPVYTSNSISPRERGRLISENFAPQIVEIFDQYYNWLPTAVSLLYTGSALTKLHPLPYYDRSSPLYGTDIETYLQKKFYEMDFKFPEHMLEEFEGMMEVVGSYVRELNKTSIVERSIPTVETMKLLAAFPDIVKMSPSEISIVHCTAAIRKLPNGNLQHLRNLDYASLGVLKQFTAIHAWLAPNNLPLASITFLPFAAAISVTNGYLTATINDAATTMTKRFEKGGIPEVLCLRYALENCTTFAELDEHFKKHYPATTCSFAISSATDGRIYQMLPIDDPNYYTIRHLSNQQGSVVVTNHHYSNNGQINQQSINWATTIKREKLACQAIAEEKNWDQVLRAVNVFETTHSMCFQYNGSFPENPFELKLSVQNYNAAACPAEQYHDIPIGEILKRVIQSP